MDEIGGIFGLIIYLAVLIFYLFVMWRVFEKAGQQGFLAIIPIVNVYVMVTELAGKPWWWMILLFIPFVNFFVGIMVVHAISENFGHGIGFTLGLIFLGFIFFPILAFGDSQFMGGRKQKYSY